MSSLPSSSRSRDPPIVEIPKKKRQIIVEQSREIIFNIYIFFKKKHIDTNILDTVAEATGICRPTICRIIREGKAIEEGKKSCFLPTKVNTPRTSPKCSVDKCGEEIIRRTIYNFHVTDKVRPTISSVYNKIKDDETIGFIGKRTSFRKLILQMGFRWKKTEDNRNVLMERNDIRELRASYIRRVTNYRRQNRPIIYTDETYIHAGHTTSYQWRDKSNLGLKCPISKGKRLIISHAGGAQGFVSNALLIFPSGKKTGDYHDDMNYENFSKWVTNKLIPNLPENSVLVLDNASYHNVTSTKHPTSQTRKSDMIKWLNERGIHYQDDFTKPELYKLIKMNKPSNTNYSIDAILAEKGHTVLRLPPYHPELNPIEKIWGIVKNRVASRNVTFKLCDVQKLAIEEFAKITPDDWSSVCKHVVNVENEYIRKEHIMDQYCEEFIINLNSDSEDDIFDFSSDED